MVPVSSIAIMILDAIMGFAVPIALAWWLVKKYKVKLSTILIGAATFIVFALILEPILHRIVLLGPKGETIRNNTWYYALYGGLAAGLFEETGRFLSMKFLMKKEPSTVMPAVAYGAGHGGAEMLILLGVSMISTLAMAMMINSGNADTLAAQAPAEAQEQLQAQLASVQSISLVSYILGLWERFSAIILQISLSVLVWAAVRKGGKWLLLFPAAILIHALVDGVVVVLQKSVSLVLLEVIIMAMAFCLAAVAFLVARKMGKEKAPENE